MLSHWCPFYFSLHEKFPCRLIWWNYAHLTVNFNFNFTMVSLIFLYFFFLFLFLTLQNILNSLFSYSYFSFLFFSHNKKTNFNALTRTLFSFHTSFVIWIIIFHLKLNQFFVTLKLQFLYFIFLFCLVI